MSRKVVIGIDQSYSDTGVAIICDGELVEAFSIDFTECNSKSDKRRSVASTVENIIEDWCNDDTETTIVVERIRLHSSNNKFDERFIQSSGALIATIVDVANTYDIKVYSVDTRAWKSSIVGTSSPQNNEYSINPKKYPTIQKVIELGYENLISYEPTARQTKGVVTKSDGTRVKYNDNIADAICISLYGNSDNPKLLLEE